jgi:CheY-like chemotaxis protein
VLIAEDNPVNQTVLRLMLQKRGCGHDIPGRRGRNAGRIRLRI